MRTGVLGGAVAEPELEEAQHVHLHAGIVGVAGVPVLHQVGGQREDHHVVDGMEVGVGKSIFTIPINSIKESFKLKESQLIHDTDGNEMIMIRGECYPLIRLYKIYDLEPTYENIFDGIIILVEAEGKHACIYADELIGEQQVVVKPFSPMFNDFNVKQNGMAGCTILGDGSITIILDVNNIISNF